MVERRRRCEKKKNERTERRCVPTRRSRLKYQRTRSLRDDLQLPASPKTSLARSAANNERPFAKDGLRVFAVTKGPVSPRSAQRASFSETLSASRIRSDVAHLRRGSASIVEEWLCQKQTECERLSDHRHEELLVSAKIAGIAASVSPLHRLSEWPRPYGWPAEACRAMAGLFAASASLLTMAGTFAPKLWNVDRNFGANLASL
jgi:hypothetical protein